MESPDFLTREQQERLLSLIDNPRHKVQILLMLDAGLRVTETCTMKWENCDFRKRELSTESLKKRKKPSASVRLIPMSERLYDAFATLIEEKGVTAKGYVFPSPMDPKKPIGRSAINNLLDRIEAEHPELGSLHPHKLRHTFATNLVAQGTELIAVRDLLGHESTRTTEIYTHADPAVLRAAINATTATRPTVGQKLAKFFKGLLGFRSAPRRINLVASDQEFIIGRDRERRRIADLVSRDVSVLITGPVGIGKTHMLQSLEFDRPTLVIDDTREFKKAMAGALLHILGGKEAVANMLYQTSDLKALEAKVSKESLPNLVQTLIDATRPREYLLKIGDVDGITPSAVKALERLKEHFTIITTARQVKMEATSFLWNFERLELEPLDRPDSLRMIYRLIGDLEIADLEAVMTKVYDTAEGNPRMMREICERLRKEPVLDLDLVNEVADSYLGRQTKELDMSIVLLLVLGGFVAMRYAGREANDTSLQVIGGCLMIVLLFARAFFNSARRKVL